MRTQILKTAILISFIFAFGGCNSNPTLATYDGGKVTNNDLQELIRIFNLSAQAKSARWKKQAVRQLVLNDLLYQEAVKKGLDKDLAALAMKNYLRLYLIRLNTEKAYEEKQKKAPIKLYRARHILLKVKQYKTVKEKNETKNVPMSPAEKEFQAKAILQQIQDLRKKILAGTLEFTKAASEMSEDPESKNNGGDLGYFPEGVMVPEFQRALYRLAGEIKSKDLWRVRDENVAGTAEPGKENTVVRLNKDAIIPVVEKKNGYLKFEYRPGEFAYITERLAFPVVQGETEDQKLSLPVRTMYGWHLIRFEEIKKATPDEYIDIVAESKFKNDKNARKNAEQFVEQQINRSLKLSLEKMRKELFSRYGLDAKRLPELPANWESQEVLFDSNGLKISAKEFREYIEAQIIFSSGSKEQMMKQPQQYKKWLNSNFQNYLQLSVYRAESEKKHNVDQKDLERQIELSFKPYMARLLKIREWYKDIKAPNDAAALVEYNKIKERAKGRELPAFEKLKETIKRQIESREQKNIDTSKEEALLKSVHFKLLDENFKEG